MHIVKAWCSIRALRLEILWLRFSNWRKRRRNDRTVGRLARRLNVRKADLWAYIQRGGFR